MNNLPGKKTIVASCTSTDLQNEHILRLVAILCAVLVGIGTGYHTAQFLDLSVPEILMWVVVALIVLILLFCVQQMLMRPVHITFFPEQGEDIILMNNHFYWVSGGAHNNSDYTLLFDKDFTVRKQRNEGKVTFQVVGKPSRQLIELLKKSECISGEYLRPYCFKDLSLSIEPSKAEEAEIQKYLGKVLLKKIRKAIFQKVS